MRAFFNKNPNATEAEIRELFGQYGQVESVAVITDRETGQARGFGFVEMMREEGERAISKLNGQESDGLVLRVNEARARL